MSLKYLAVNAVLKELNIKREKATALAAARMNAAFAVDEISTAQRTYVNTLYASYARKASADDVQAAHDAYVRALKQYGYDESEFTALPECAICKDTGFANGKLCACTRPKYLAELSKLCNSERFPFHFADNNAKSIADPTQNSNLKKLYAAFKKYATDYPNTSKTTFTFSGGIGTGKTCLAQAVANAFLERGLSVKYVSAYEFNSAMLAAYLAPVQQKEGMLEDFVTADLLVVDDLGTEPLLKNVTCEYLLLVLNERQLALLPTIFTTNYAANNLLDRYGERFFSRLTDKRTAFSANINGKDLRH